MEGPKTLDFWLVTEVFRPVNFSEIRAGPVSEIRLRPAKTQYQGVRLLTRAVLFRRRELMGHCYEDVRVERPYKLPYGRGSVSSILRRRPQLHASVFLECGSCASSLL